MNTENVEATGLGLTLTTDRPISNESEDRLVRGPFVTRLSNAITSWRGDDGVVIGLYGPWGCGKSSVKNLVVEKIAESNSASVEVIEFNPWQWRGHDDVSAAFFREVLRKLGSVHDPHDKGKAAKKIRRYAKFLGIGHAFFDGVKGVVASLVGIVGFLGLTLPTILGAGAIAATAHVLALSCVAIAGILVFGERLLERIADWFDAQFEFGQESLEEQKRSVADALRDYPKSFLIVIDDVDRLSKSEIQAVFQLIKANADFPNFVYLILFQRDVVEKALEQEAGWGAKYLEKIVQVGFDLPPSPRAEIEKILFDGLDTLLDKDLAKFDSLYWHNVYHSGLRQYFTNLREVKRFLGVFGFNIGLLRVDGVLEVNPVDLIALETLSLFEPAFYAALPAQQALLTGRANATKNRAKLIEDCGAIVGLAPEHRREGLTDLMRYLFPPVGDAFGGMQHGSDLNGEWIAELRVCSPEIFSRYFERSLSSHDVSQAEVNRLISLTSDGESLTDQLKIYATDGRLMTALERFAPAIKTELASVNVADTLIALFNIGDDLPEDEPGAFSMPSHWVLLGLITTALKRETNEDKRDNDLERAIRETSGLGMAVTYVGHESRQEARKNHPDSFAIRGATVSRFSELCVERIREAASNGTLHQQRNLAHILYRWRDWSTADEVRAWVNNLTVSLEGTLIFLKAFLACGASHTAGDKVARTHWYIKLSDTDNFADSSHIESMLKNVSLASLSERDRRAVEAFRRAVTRKQDGKTEGAFGREEE